MDKAKRIELKQGISLTLLNTDKFKTSCIGANFLCTLDRDSASQYAILPGLLRVGSRNYPDMTSMSLKLDSLYGARIEPYIRKKGAALCTGFVCDVINSAYALKGENLIRSIGQMLREIIMNPLVNKNGFTDQNTRGERENLMDKIEAQINDKRQYSLIRLFEIMCEDEKFGINEFGSVETARKITGASAFDAYRSMLTDVPLELFYCGPEKPESILEVFHESFETLPAGQKNIPQTELRYNSSKVKYVEETMDVAQAKLAMGFRTGITGASESYPALVIFNAIFGGGTASKLFLNVREKLSLCYYASSQIRNLNGIMAVSSGIEAGNYEAAKDEILKQLSDIKEGNISDFEFCAAMNTAVNSLTASDDSLARLEDFWLTQAVGNRRYDTGDLVENIKKVTLDDVQKVAKNVMLDTIYLLKGRG